MTEIADIWLENRRSGNTIGIDEERPRLSWIGGGAGTVYDLEFERFGGGTQTASSERSTLVDWPFLALRPRDGGILRIRPRSSAHWSDPIVVEAGIGDGWDVDFASPSTSAPDDAPRPAYLMRAEFDLGEMGLAPADVARARVYSTAHGVYELELNGAALGDDRLAPGWTSYRNRLRYQTHVIEHRLHEGRNVLGAWLADGWYRGHVGFDGGLWNIYGTDVSLLLQLEIHTVTGRLVVVPLTWRWHESPISSVGLYEGEVYDARRLPAGWSARDFDVHGGWKAVERLPRPSFSARIEAPTALPVVETEALVPVRVERTARGRIRLDFGQNIAGVLRIRPRGERGHVVRLHHAEVLENNELGTRPLRGATSIDTYVCNGEPGEVYSPRFTIHGFQYAELENWPGELEPGDVEALVIHTGMQRTGWFASSNPDLNQLHSNVLWSMRDNFVDIPTDCPQRDERVGWTGDIQIFAPTGLRLFAANGTLTGWLRDLAFEQWPNGHVPQFVPWVQCGFPNFPTAVWGDAAVIVPWEMYLNDGDIRILHDQYTSMKAWVDLVDRLTGHTGLWDHGFQLGDWLDPTAPPDSPGSSRTDRYLVSTAYHVRTARILADTADLLDNPADAERYRGIAQRATAAFQGEFISPSGRVVSDTPTGIAVALMFDLFRNEQEAERAGKRLLRLVAENGFHISTGFVGTPIICDAIVKAGDADFAYHLLLQKELPSWLYAVTMGATTIWERWDSMLPDGSINPGDMTSFNHYALGAVADFLHRVVGGLAPAAPGWTRIRFAPRPGGGLEHASTSYDAVTGHAAISWRREGATLSIDVEVPAMATGVVILPGSGEEIEVGPGHHAFTTTFRAAADDPETPVPGWRRGPVEV